MERERAREKERQRRARESNVYEGRKGVYLFKYLKITERKDREKHLKYLREKKAVGMV